ncbi:MAG: M20/M25/M40 family metallo-hydrolase [Frankiales bacterium]|nr:M20/M25/M40 family metallo-hydrolase [Frankiales bacterium]
MPAPLPDAEAEVVELVRDLIRIDTSNYGDGSGPGEAEAAEYVEGRLREVGLDPQRYSCGPRRDGVVVRIPGRDASRGALMVHGHLDVVPARAEDWSRPPFAAEVDDDLGVPMVWGRGAVDMKDMCGMTLAVVRSWARAGIVPERDIVVNFLPDEEAGGEIGSHWLVEHTPEMFEGVTEAVGEVGGFSLTVRDDLRLYLVQTAEKGIGWLRLRATGRAGHGSMLNDDNSVTALCETVARLGRLDLPVHVTPAVRDFLAVLSEATGADLDPDDMDATLAKLGPMATLVGATLKNTVNPTMLSAGYKVNVIPGEAEAHVDARYLPGHEDEMWAAVDAALGEGVVREFVHQDIAVETTFDGPSIDLMAAALRAEDEHAVPVPYMLSGGTDAKAFSTLGIRCYGFAPLRLPPALNFGALFHGVDERVPVDALHFGTRVLGRFLRAV